MNTRYVEVPPDMMRERLKGAGFYPTAESCDEEVWERPHDRDGKYRIRVYTSISTGDERTRACGTDAIRVVVVLITPNKTYGIYKSARVYRTGTAEAVCERTIERARDCYAAINAHRLKMQRNRSR